MKTSYFNSGYTLIELIVSMTLVAVVVAGIVAINVSLSSNNVDYGQRFMIKSQTQATLNHILNNASMAYGSAQTNDEGILLGAAVGDANSFCIHQPGGAANNLIGSVNPIWLCYTLTPATFQINYCAETYSGPGADPRGAASCTTSTHILSGPTFVGTANSVTAGYDRANGFSVTIQNCLNNAAASCNGGGAGISSDTAGNPEVSISGNAYPAQYSA